MSGGPVFSFNFADDDRDDRDEQGDNQKPTPMDTSDDSNISSEHTRSVNRETSNVMTKYEKTRIIGARATLIARGAKPLVDTNGESDPQEIAKKELYARVLPIIICRPLPNGTTEEWSVQELKLPPQ